MQNLVAMMVEASCGIMTPWRRVKCVREPFLWRNDEHVERIHIKE
jgi:hypothetical protein